MSTTLHNLECLFRVQSVSGIAMPCGRRPVRAKYACSPLGLLQALPAWQDSQQRQQPASTSGRPSVEAPHRCSSGLLGSQWSLHSQQTLPTVCRGFAAVSATLQECVGLELPTLSRMVSRLTMSSCRPPWSLPVAWSFLAPMMQFASSWPSKAALCAARQPSKVVAQLTTPLPAYRLLQWT